MIKPRILEVSERYVGGRHRRVVTLELNTEQANELALHISGEPLFDEKTVEDDMKRETELDAEADHVAEHGDQPRPLQINEHDQITPPK